MDLHARVMCSSVAYCSRGNLPDFAASSLTISMFCRIDEPKEASLRKVCFLVSRSSLLARSAGPKLARGVMCATNPKRS